MSDLPERDLPTTAPPRRLRGVIHLVIVAVILVGAWALADHLVNTQPQARRRPATRQAQLVEVTAVEQGSHTVRIEASGTVMPSRQITLFPRVQGEVIQISPELEPGGLVAADAILLEIDTVDYALAEKQAKANLARAQADLRIERGNQAVAKAERALIGLELKGGDEALMLRKPQLDAARAAVEVARAALERARVDLERTHIKAPFAGVVQSRAVNLGSRVTASTELGRLVGTATWWIEVALPVDQLRWITLPEGDRPGSPVTIRSPAAWGPAVSRPGRVIRQAAELEERGRMARLLVAVDDPMSLADPTQPRLHLGAWVQVELDGQPIERAVALPRKLLRDDTRVFVMTPNDTLDIRTPTVAWRGREEVLITAGLAAGDRIVTTDLPTPVQGMALALVGAKKAAPESAAPDGAQARRRKAR